MLSETQKTNADASKTNAESAKMDSRAWIINAGCQKTDTETRKTDAGWQKTDTETRKTMVGTQKTSVRAVKTNGRSSKTVLGALIFFLATPCLQATAPRGVVLLIADGTSLELLSAARIYQGGVTGKLALDSMPQTAFVSTWSYDSMVTDSGAAATALARGIKTINRAVGTPPEGKPRQSSVIELAKKAGWATGVITDDSVTGGTPAPYLVEHDHREEEYLIANLEMQSLGKSCDFLFGGGQRYFQGNGGPSERDRTEAAAFRDTLEKLPKSGITVFSSWVAWDSAPPKDLNRPILGIFAPDKLDFIADVDRRPHLEDMVSEGLRLLQNSGKPWMLVAEAGLPDKACHLGNMKRALEEVLVLDRTVALIRSKIGPDVLFLITTDHNTGGLTLGPGLPISAKGDALLRSSPITKMPVLTFASGPGGVLDTADMIATPLKNDVDYTRPDAVSPALLKTGAAFHSGGNVWLLGQGPGSERVHGFLDNTDIYRIMTAAIQGE